MVEAMVVWQQWCGVGSSGSGGGVVKAVRVA